MERLKCKACGSYGMIPVELDDVDPEEEQDLDDLLDPTDEETRFYSCHVCGDNWLTVRRVEEDGACALTFVHQMGLRPTLRRVAHLPTHIVINEQTVDRWD